MMNDKINNMSLSQGQKFNLYQNKIKTQTYNNYKQTNKCKNKPNFSYRRVKSDKPLFEGYESMNQSLFGNSNSNSISNTNSNSNHLHEINHLEQRYNKLMQEYIQIETKIKNSSLKTIDRISSNNPFLNNLMSFSKIGRAHV